MHACRQYERRTGCSKATVGRHCDAITPAVGTSKAAPPPLTLSRTDWHLGCERSRSPNADRPVRGRCSPARRQLKPTLGRAIDWHRCSLPQRVQLSGRLPASCLQVAEQRRSCPALDGGGQLWLEDGGCFEAAAAQVWFRGCQHAARGPIPCLGRRVPVTCSSSRRVLTPW